MNGLKAFKAAFVFACVAAAALCIVPASLMQATDGARNRPPTPETTYLDQDYVGSENCEHCHEAQFKSFSKTAHAKLTAAGWKPEQQGCESCHGPGRAHIEGAGDKTRIRTFQHESAKQISDSCLRCHAGKEERNNFRRGEHWRNDVGCIDCHSPHVSERAVLREAGLSTDHRAVPSSTLSSSGRLPSLSTDQAPAKMLVKPDPQLCITCHNETRAQFLKPFHHRVLEGAMKCSDCHNQHGGFEQKQLRLVAGADQTCVKCHSDKQGPFVFEHPPAKIEGCATCHDAHGSSNPRLLKRTAVAQLCIECHTDSHQAAAPNTPNFHNLEQARYQNCTTCHVKIHGSNAHPRFFR
jgi:predicted CXXCH cytochrome family protein